MHALLQNVLDVQRKKDAEEELARSQIKVDVYYFDQSFKDTHVTVSVRHFALDQIHTYVYNATFQIATSASTKDLLVRALEMHGIADKVSVENCQFYKYSCHQAMPGDAVVVSPSITLKDAGIVSYYDDVCS